MGWYSNVTICFGMLGQNRRIFTKTTSSVLMSYWSVDKIYKSQNSMRT